MQLMRRVVSSIAFATALALLQGASPVLAQRDPLRAAYGRAHQLVNAGRYAEAVPFAEHTAELARTRFGNEHQEYGDALDFLGTLYTFTLRHAEAEAAYKHGLTIRENALGSEHKDVAISLNNLGILYINLGRYAEAEPLLMRNLAIGEKTDGPDSLDVEKSVLNLGLLYDEQGRYSEAEPLLKRSLAICEKLLGPTDYCSQSALINLGNVYTHQARYEEAEGMYKRGIAITEKVLGPMHFNVGRSLANLADLYNVQGRYAEAEPLYKRSIAIQERWSRTGEELLSLSAYGLGALYNNQARYTDAEPLFKRSLTIREKLFGTEHPYVAAVLNGLATAYSRQGSYDRAEPLFRRSLAIRETLLGPEHPDVAASLGDFGAMELERHHFEVAHNLLQRAAAIQSGRELKTAQNERSWTGRRKERAVYFRVTSAAWGLSLEQPMNQQKLASGSFDAAQWGMRAATGSALGQMAVRFGAGSTELAGRVRDGQDLARHWQSLDKALTVALSEPPARRNDGRINELKRELTAVDTALKDLTQVLEREFPSYVELASPKPLPLLEAKRLLAPTEAMVIYMVGESDETFVWAVTREGILWQRIPLGDKALADKVALLRRGLGTEDPKQAAKEGRLFNLGLAHEVHAAVLGPVWDLIKAKRDLIIVPSAALTSLPFHLLVTQQPTTLPTDSSQLRAYHDAAWLVRTHAVTVLPSVSSLKALRVLAKGGGAAKPLVGFGDPVFSVSGARDAKVADVTRGRTRAYSTVWRDGIADLDALRRLSPLPETAGELRAVAKALGANASDLYLQAAASETTVKRLDLASYRVVYFATHGLVGGEVKGLGEPALALSLPTSASDLDDGLLTASEVAQLKLNADWVVLSACNTAAGETIGADAFSGLARSFFYAGARSLLVSHWQVDSESAVKLTTSTFAALQKDSGIGKAEGLRRAMLTMIDDTSNPWNAYPDYWAAFSVVGEGGR